jgi:hypothetical protein
MKKGQCVKTTLVGDIRWTMDFLIWRAKSLAIESC